MFTVTLAKWMQLQLAWLYLSLHCVSPIVAGSAAGSTSCPAKPRSAAASGGRGLLRYFACRSNARSSGFSSSSSSSSNSSSNSSETASTCVGPNGERRTERTAESAKKGSSQRSQALQVSRTGADGSTYRRAKESSSSRAHEQAKKSALQQGTNADGSTYNKRQGSSSFNAQTASRTAAQIDRARRDGSTESRSSNTVKTHQRQAQRSSASEVRRSATGDEARAGSSSRSNSESRSTSAQKSTSASAATTKCQRGAAVRAARSQPSASQPTRAQHNPSAMRKSLGQVSNSESKKSVRRQMAADPPLRSQNPEIRGRAKVKVSASSVSSTTASGKTTVSGRGYTARGESVLTKEPHSAPQLSTYGAVSAVSLVGPGTVRVTTGDAQTAQLDTQTVAKLCSQTSQASSLAPSQHGTIEVFGSSRGALTAEEKKLGYEIRNGQIVHSVDVLSCLDFCEQCQAPQAVIFIGLLLEDKIVELPVQLEPVLACDSGLALAEAK